MGRILPSLSTTLLLLTLISLSLSSDEYDVFLEFAAGEEERGLFPNIFNLATNALIWADATCGQQQREVYCKLVEHVFNRQPQCDVCDDNDIRKRHPIEYAIDGTRKWWQSPSLANGLGYEKVNITIDLRQEYQVAYIIIKSAIAPRPGTWVLEKSLDGINYQPWQYFATSDSECMRVFGVPASVGGVPRFTRDDEVICTSYFSKLDPLENGEIHTSLINGRPSAEAASELLQNFTRTRFVRLRLLSLRTLNADLMVINHHGASSRLDMSVTRRYFYAIKDISIGGQCICYGHAETCPPDPVTGQFKCECRHNTCGESCNKCCPLFNQLPWRQGTQSQPNICQACQCFNHADSCVYDEEIEKLGLSLTPEGIFEGGGRCLECKHNTYGINCERCKWTYYRPSGVTHYREDACRPCDCDPVGSEHQNCVRDETSAVDGQKPGDCICKPGFGGRRCDRCAVGYRNHPKCDPCPCNQAGSLNFDTCEEEKCVCKPNVEGLYCDRCKPGTINLNVKDPQGCQACFCFGLGRNCSENHWAKGTIRSNAGWLLTDLAGQKEIKPKTENEELLMFNSNDHKDIRLFYWKAPEAFRGNLLNSYGGILQYYVYFVPSDNGRSVAIADVILQGNGIELEYHSRQDFFPRENISVQIPLKEGNGWYNSRTRLPAEKADMMRVLADVKYFKVRAMYHENQLQSSIYGLALDTAIDGSASVSEISDDDKGQAKRKANSNALMRGVEVCECPENYAGYSCESCAAGYRRVNNQLYGGKCEKCNCEGHSDHCDPFTGHCLNCKHNTTGERCELCLPGFYGNPSLGGDLGQCRQCACPTLENNHSSQCTLTQLVVGEAAAVDEDAYVCTACETGYDGNKCEVCADGYFGDPLAANGSCQLCNCSGNIDIMGIGNCDSVSGKCLKCMFNTAGDHCDVCKENHWGSAVDKTCTPCKCHSKGALSQKCDVESGYCQCHENYEGKQCDKCKDGHGDIENMCPACNCNRTGAIGTECDQVSGQCVCKTGVFGKQCDMCRSGYFNFTENGCRFCHCDVSGAIDDGRCNNFTGKCECHPNVDGNMCEKCVDGFFNISSGVGCQECNCDKKGSEGIHCDIRTGQCVCKPGVTGLKCDKCAPKHYGLDENGCKECKVCPAPGQVCDPISGECVCPPNTVGNMCENCTKNAWDYDPLKGCTLCDCSEIGADGPDCNSNNGQCICRKGFVGLKCDHCTHGYFNFPKCEPCNCDVSGTIPKACGAKGACLCDEKGQCPCKKNVKGLKCDQCDASSFSLDKGNPLGCTECFCFNRTDLCVQSSFVWQQIYAQDREVTFTEPWKYLTRRHNINTFAEQPQFYNSYPSSDEPSYWPLPKSFLGDRTASYNGFIRFRIVNKDNRRGIDNVLPDPRFFKYHPQVILVANHRIFLEHIPESVVENGRYKVRLHESQWRSRLSPDLRVTRKQMMVALQNLQEIFVRGTYNAPNRGDTAAIKDVSLDIAVWDNTTESAETTALGVEMCECPREYSGSSCQDPAEGYCRRKNHDYLNSEDDLALIGVPTPCACNGHSTTCDPETCQCTDCEHNTIGDFCQLCKPGYHGDAFSGGADACQKCACPLAENSFSDTCVPIDHGRGYMCNACKPGYTGMYCESCVSGYFGDPNVPGGFCDECACHPDGSKHGVCDSVTGQCECHSGVTGRDCSLCQERHAFIDGVCASCDQGCTKELMIMIDELEETMGAQNFSGLRPIPWKRMSRIRNTTESLNAVLDSLSLKDGKNLAIKDIPESRFTEVKMLLEHATQAIEKSNKSYNSVLDMINKTIDLEDTVQKQNAHTFHVVQELMHFIKYGGSKHDNSVVDSWIAEAAAYLNATEERGDYMEKQYLRGNSDYGAALKLLETITERKFNYLLFENLKNRSNELKSAIGDYRTAIWEKAGQDTIAANKISAVLAKRLEEFNDFVANISEDIAKTEDELTTAKNFVAKTKNEHLLSMFDDYQHINDSSLPSVRNGLLKCRSEADKYSQLLEEYKRNYVDTSEVQADKLKAEAANLKNSFADTKLAAENPVKASNSYKEIVEALKNASSAAENAKQAAKDAHAEAVMDSDKSMVKMAANSRQHSLTLVHKNENKMKDLETMEEGRKEFQKKLEAIQEAVAKGKTDKAKKEGEFLFHDQQHERLSGVLQSAKDVEALAADLSNRAKEVQQSINYLAPQVGKIHGSTSESIGVATSDVRKAKSEIDSAKQTIEKIHDLLSKGASRNDDLRSQLTSLKEKIKEAREKAAKMRMAIKSDEFGLCQRSYISPIQPAPSNAISLKYRPAENVPNSLIFLTRTKKKRTQPSEYIAIEIRDRRVVAHWNVGGGARKVTNTHPINPIVAEDRYTWYQIDLNRAGDSMSVTVTKKCTKDPECLSGDSVVVSVGDNKEGDSAILNSVVGKTRIQIGCDGSVVDELGFATNNFYGTIGEIIIDGEYLPLWLFKDTTDQCKGAQAVPADSSGGHMFKDGYAQYDLQTAETNKGESRLKFHFSGYSLDGLIYFRGDSKKGDFVALEIRDGRIVYKINLGDDSYASAQSQKATYNDGRTHVVDALRRNMQIALIVDDSDKSNVTTIPGNGAKLDVDSKHFIGGVPPDFNVDAFARFDIRWSGFFGCIQLVEVSQLYKLDLERPERSHKMSAGCAYSAGRLKPTDKVIGFPVPGYLVTQGIQFDQNSTLSFNMRSLEENAVLLYQSSSLQIYKKGDKVTDVAIQGEGYMSFYLYRGYLVAHIGTDSSSRSKVVTLRSEVRLNDGNLHCIFLARFGNNVRLRIDDREVAVGILQDDTVIGGPSSQMFIGGFPEGVQALDKEIPTDNNLIGCISDMFFDYKRFPIVPEAHFANIGSCAIDDIFPQNPSEELKDTAFLARHSKLRLELTEPTFATSEHLLHNDEIEIWSTELSAPKPPAEPLVEVSSGESKEVDPDEEISKCDGSLAISDGQNCARFGITESSYTKLNFKEPLPNVNLNDMSFGFRTEQKDGLFWIWPNKFFTRYFYLRLKDGFLTVEVKGRKEPAILPYKSDALNDGMWHYVEVKKEGDEMMLRVDSYPIQYVKNVPSPKVNMKRLYIGNVISRHRKQFNLTITPFIGCMRDFYFNGEPIDLFAEKRDLIPCTAPSESSYIHTGGFITFDPLKTHNNEDGIGISLKFRPGVNGGAIIGLMTTKDPETSHVILYAQEGKVVFQIALKGWGRPKKYTFGHVLCDGNSHHVAIHISTSEVLVELNNVKEHLTGFTLSSNALKALRDLPIHIGGVSATIAKKIGVTSMSGCYSDLRFGGKPIAMESARKIGKVFHKTCLYQEKK